MDNANVDIAPVSSGGAPAIAPSSWAAEARATFRLAWPLIIAQLAQNLLFTTDVVLMGWLGPKYLAAGTLAGAVLMPLMLTGVGIVGAVAPLVAQARGARRIRNIGPIVRQGLWVAILVATILQPVVIFGGWLYGHVTADPDVPGLVFDYILFGSWMLYPALMAISVRSLLAAYGDTRSILVITVSGVVVNAFAAYALIFGHFGMPRLELRGAAIATGIVNLVMFVAMLGYALRHRRFKRLHILARFWSTDWTQFRSIFRIGIPIGLTILAEVGLFSAAALMMGRLGTNEVAAHAVALQLAATAFMIPLGLGMAATVRVGIAYGANDLDGIHKAGWTAISMSLGVMCLTCLAFIVVPGTLVSIFLDHSKPDNAIALGLAATYLAIAGIFQLADGAQVVAAHALRGLSDTRTPMFLAILGYWAVGLPIAWLLGFVLNWQGVGIWLGLAAGLGFCAIVLVARFAMRERLGLVRPLALR